jgi:hypothetical protein
MISWPDFAYGNLSGVVLTLAAIWIFLWYEANYGK